MSLQNKEEFWNKVEQKSFYDSDSYCPQDKKQYHQEYPRNIASSTSLSS